MNITQYLIVFRKIHLVYKLVSVIPVVDHISIEYTVDFPLQFPGNFVSGMCLFSTGPLIFVAYFNSSILMCNLTRSIIGVRRTVLDHMCRQNY